MVSSIPIKVDIIISVLLYIYILHVIKPRTGSGYLEVIGQSKGKCLAGFGLRIGRRDWVEGEVAVPRHLFRTILGRIRSLADAVPTPSG